MAMGDATTATPTLTTDVRHRRRTTAAASSTTSTYRAYTARRPATDPHNNDGCCGAVVGRAAFPCAGICACLGGRVAGWSRIGHTSRAAYSRCRISHDTARRRAYGTDTSRPDGCLHEFWAFSRMNSCFPVSFLRCPLHSCALLYT